MDSNIFKCPHCGMEYDGLEYIEVGDMDGKFNMCCDGCEKEFTIKFLTKIIFKTEK